MGAPSDRVSDADREQAVVALRADLLAGRLALEDFAERTEFALQARTRGDLDRARSDLPAESPRRESNRKPTRFTGAFFGSVERRGRLRLRRWTVAVSAFGDVDLDLRAAEIERAQTAVTLMPLFGNVDVYLPEGVNVDVTGLTIVGRRRDWGRDLAAPDAPSIRIRAVGVFGTVDVWRVPHGMHGSYREIIRKLQEQQRELPA